MSIVVFTIVPEMVPDKEGKTSRFSPELLAILEAMRSEIPRPLRGICIGGIIDPGSLRIGGIIANEQAEYFCSLLGLRSELATVHPYMEEKTFDLSMCKRLMSKLHENTLLIVSKEVASKLVGREVGPGSVFKLKVTKTGPVKRPIPSSSSPSSHSSSSSSRS